MLKEDFVIQAGVRRVLVRSNIDYSSLSFGTVKGVVYFGGLFRVVRIYLHRDDEKIEYLKTQDFIQKSLASLEKKVKNLPGVKDVIFQFINWRKEVGQWVPVKERRKGVREVLAPGIVKKPEGKRGSEEKEEKGVEEEERGEGED